jgi:hypothetical protein
LLLDILEKEPSQEDVMRQFFKEYKFVGDGVILSLQQEIKILEQLLEAEIAENKRLRNFLERIIEASEKALE